MRLSLFLFALISGLLSSSVSRGQQSWQWAFPDGSSNRYEYMSGLARTADGGVIVMGSRHGPRTTQLFFGTWDVVATKYDSVGAIVWRRVIGNQDSEVRPFSVSIAPSGDIYALIGFSGTVNLNSVGQFVSSAQGSAGGLDGLLIKINASGSIQWAKQMVGNSSNRTNNVFPQQVLVDAAGRIWVGGSFYNSLTIDNFFVLRTGNVSSFLARFDAAGHAVNLIAGGGTTNIGRLATDARGYLYVAGSLSGTVDFGTFRVRVPRIGYYVAKYDSQLQPRWVRLSDTAAVGTGSMELQGFARDAQGGYVVAGKMEGTNRFGTNIFVTPPTNHNDLFVARYDSSGTVQWARKAEGASSERIHALVMDSVGNTYLGGGYFGNFNLAGRMMPADSTNFISRLDAAGNVGWFMPVGGNASAYTWYWNESTVDLTLGPNRSLYVAGCFAGTTNFGSTTLASQGGDDYYVARLLGAAPVGLPETAAVKRISLYPNPANEADGVTLEIGQPLPQDVLVQLRNVLGQVVAEAVLPAGRRQAHLPVAGLGKGLYTVRLQLGSAMVNRKLAIE